MHIYVKTIYAQHRPQNIAVVVWAISFDLSKFMYITTIVQRQMFATKLVSKSKKPFVPIIWILTFAQEHSKFETRNIPRSLYYDIVSSNSIWLCLPTVGSYLFWSIWLFNRMCVYIYIYCYCYRFDDLDDGFPKPVELDIWTISSNITS